MKIRRIHGKLTPEERQRHQQIRQQVEHDKAELTREALEHKAELQTLIEATRLLRREREARGLSLAEVAKRSGIDKSRLSKLENDPYPNPTLATLIRIADAIGVKLTISLAAA